MASDLLLVGSIPLDTPEQVFRRVGGPLGPYLAYMPDGEVGDRRYWIDGIAYRVFNGHPEIETLRRPTPDANGVVTSGMLAVAALPYRGATIGLYSCIGFGAGFLGTLLFGVTLDQFGGASQLIAWIVSFGTCGLACLAGAAATIFLSRDVWQRRS